MIGILEIFMVYRLRQQIRKGIGKIYNKFIQEDKQLIELDFGNTPEKLRGDYSDMYKGIQSEVMRFTRFLMRIKI